MDILKEDWYIQPPIDFEHKQYILFAYLQEVDTSYLSKKVSPHLLQLERLEKELKDFLRSFSFIEDRIDRSKYVYFDNVSYQEEPLVIKEVKEIVDFSIPQIESRILTGYRIFKKYKQILY